MKLTAFIMLIFCLQVSARVSSQSITLSVKDATLPEVFEQVIYQSGISIVYDNSILAGLKRVSFEVTNAEVEEVLNICLKGQPLKYSYQGKTIIIKPTPDLSQGLGEHHFSDALPPPITGVIRDADGNPLAGVNIVVKGTKRGVVSDVYGNFKIDAKEGEVLIISSINYGTKEVKISAPNAQLIVALDKNVSQLDEVQYIAYGTQTKRLSVGNVTSVKSADIEKQPINNPLYALQGRVPGLVITPTTGLAGGPVNIQLRGNNSLTFTTSPLIVIDGLPVVNNIAGLGGPGSLNQLSALNFINPNDIESIDVLKDADATSIYGSRGANGVVLITTKKGKTGKTQVDINAQSGIGQVEKKWKLLDTKQYLQLRRESFAKAGIDFVNTFPYNDPNQKYNVAYDLFLWDTTRYIDWQKELIGKSASYNDVQVSMSGGSSNVQYIIGGNYHEETTVYRTNFDDRKGTARLSLTGISNNHKLKATVSASYTKDRNLLPQDDMTQKIRQLEPNAPDLFHPDGSINYEINQFNIATFANPYAYMKRIYRATVDNLISSASVSYQPLPSLTISAQLGYNSTKGNSVKIFPLSALSPTVLSFLTAHTERYISNVANLNFEPKIEYKKQIAGGAIEALVGASIQSTAIETQATNATGYTSDALMLNLSAATGYTLSNTSSQYKYNGLFARLRYNWKNKYLVDFNGRRDGSSRFGPGSQFGNFGSLGMAWIFTEENFIKNALPYLSFGKLRFSYGSAGNDGIADYAYYEHYSPILLSPGGYQGGGGLTTSGIYNPDYHWETTRKMEFGLELGFLKDRILLNASYYRNRSGNQLVGLSLPSFVGPGSSIVNLNALIQNTGQELILNTINVRSKKFTWSTAITFTRNRNKLLSFPDLDNSPYYASLRVGEPFYGIQRVYNAAGVDPASGKYQFVNVDGQKVFDPTDAGRLDYGQYVDVYTLPKFYGGIANTLSYKGWSLDFLLQFTKQMGRNPVLDYIGGYPTISVGNYVNLPEEILNNMWQKTGDNATYPEWLGFGDYSFYQQSYWELASTAAWVDASFIKLKNLSLSYSIPNTWKQRMHLQNLRIYTQGQNLFTVTKYKGLDAEVQSVTSLPPLRVITVGIQVTF